MGTETSVMGAVKFCKTTENDVAHTEGTWVITLQLWQIVSENALGIYQVDSELGLTVQQNGVIMRYVCAIAPQ